MDKGQVYNEFSITEKTQYVLLKGSTPLKTYDDIESATIFLYRRQIESIADELESLKCRLGHTTSGKTLYVAQILAVQAKIQSLIASIESETVNIFGANLSSPKRGEEEEL